MVSKASVQRTPSAARRAELDRADEAEAINGWADLLGTLQNDFSVPSDAALFTVEQGLRRLAARLEPSAR